MTAENPVPQDQIFASTPGAIIFDRLRSYENGDALIESVQTGDPKVLDLDRIPAIVEKENPGLKSVHSLLGVIRAGGETFGIVAAKSYDAEKRGDVGDLLITRFKKSKDNPEERASIVGIIRPGEGAFFGRTGLEADGFEDVADTMSRVHFGLQLSEDGKHLIVSDERSTNGTELLTAQKSYPRFRDMFTDFTVWSASTETTNKVLQEGIPKRQEKPRVPLERAVKIDPVAIDPVALSNIEHMKEQKGVSIYQLFKMGEPTELTIHTGTGVLRLSHNGETDKPVFTVVESEGENPKKGTTIMIQGATVGGSMIKPDVILQNSRIGIAIQKKETYTIGSKDEGKTLTIETVEDIKRNHPNLIVENEDGTVTMLYTRPFATDFISHVELTRMSEEGVQTETLF